MERKHVRELSVVRKCLRYPPQRKSVYGQFHGHLASLLQNFGAEIMDESLCIKATHLHMVRKAERGRSQDASISFKSTPLMT